MSFEDLDPPLQEPHGSKCLGLWFVAAVAGGFLCNDDSNKIENVGVSHGDNKKFYFPTEADAHLAGATYYRSHTMIYPYQNEWSASLNHPSKPPITSGSVKSETMEF